MTVLTSIKSLFEVDLKEGSILLEKHLSKSPHKICVTI
jgi:hypothetical protein